MEVRLRVELNKLKMEIMSKIRGHTLQIIMLGLKSINSQYTQAQIHDQSILPVLFASAEEV